MTYDQEINYMRLALQLQDIGCSNQMAETIVVTHRAVLKKKGRFSIDDAVRIRCGIEKKYLPENTTEFEELESLIDSDE